MDLSISPQQNRQLNILIGSSKELVDTPDHAPPPANPSQRNLSGTTHASLSSRKSTPPHNRQLNNLITNSRQ